MTDTYDDTEELKFTFGLVNCENKYLTAETFGFKIAASASSMKKKQIWSLEQEEDGSVVYFKSHLGRYLGTDQNGVVTCDATAPCADHCFQVEATNDGRWALKNATHGQYFGGKEASLDGFEKTIRDDRLWTVHLAMHPQINLFSSSRSRYAHLKDNQVRFTKQTPWGVDALITLVYKSRSYGLMTSDNRYLNRDGELSGKFDEPTTAFTLEFYAGSIAFKNKNGKYLSPQGPHGVLQCRKGKVTRDEKFTLKDSHPQITLFSTTRNKFVSTRQGVQVICNQFEAEDPETFQMEMNPSTGQWSLRDMHDRFWTVKDGNIMANKDRTSKSWFDVKWKGRTIQIITPNGIPVGMKSGGNLIVKNGGEPTDFVFGLINRPVVVFRGEYGFIGHRATKLEGNRANYEVYEMQEKDGGYAFKGSNGRYWKVEDDGNVSMGGDSPEYFTIELKKHALMAIKSEKTGGYIKSDHAGLMNAKGDADDKFILWEY